MVFSYSILQEEIERMTDNAYLLVVSKLNKKDL